MNEEIRIQTIRSSFVTQQVKRFFSAFIEKAHAGWSYRILNSSQGSLLYYTILNFRRHYIKRKETHKSFKVLIKHLHCSYLPYLDICHLNCKQEKWIVNIPNLNDWLPYLVCLQRHALFDFESNSRFCLLLQKSSYLTLILCICVGRETNQQQVFPFTEQTQRHSLAFPYIIIHIAWCMLVIKMLDSFKPMVSFVWFQLGLNTFASKC